MQSFRDITPIRRPNRRECKHYYSYLSTLREDFNYRCGYCNDHDGLRIRSFTIDHFVPQNPEGFAHNIKPNYYYNLVYACRYCNAEKRNKWPTKDVNVSHDGTIGFIDPTEEDYTKLFRRSKSGKIIPSEDSNLAKYIRKELKLWLPIHALMWKLERMNNLIDQIENELRTTNDQVLKAQLEQLYFLYLKKYRNIQKSVFIENE
ncbi:HNH endonuclease [Haliscomenobacter hydrossis]|nr:HNH endonuclease [Haliscomenobacter hydrossis]